jgi:transcription antitermination factor NusG
MENRQWRGLYVRKHFEQIVAQHLEKWGFETFVPFCQSRRSSADGKKRIDVPLFPGYVFCKCDVAALRSIYLVPGVLAVIQIANPVSIIPTQEIEDIRRVVNSEFPYEQSHYTPGRLVSIEDHHTD